MEVGLGVDIIVNKEVTTIIDLNIRVNITITYLATLIQYLF